MLNIFKMALQRNVSKRIGETQTGSIDDSVAMFIIANIIVLCSFLFLRLLLLLPLLL